MDCPPEQKEVAVVKRSGGREVLPYKRLMGMCRWIGSHFHDRID